MEKLLTLLTWKDGDPYWKKKAARCTKLGTLAGSISSYGYRRIYSTLNGHGSEILVHRLVFYKEYGYLPPSIDHINGDKLDNRVENLRPATPTQQLWNKPKKEGCSSRYKGVHWHKGTKKWHANIRINGKKVHLGSFDNEDEAGEAFNLKARQIHGEFFRE